MYKRSQTSGATARLPNPLTLTLLAQHARHRIFRQADDRNFIVAASSKQSASSVEISGAKSLAQLTDDRCSNRWSRFEVDKGGYIHKRQFERFIARELSSTIQSGRQARPNVCPPTPLQNHGNRNVFRVETLTRD
jgi:hypothetical protein